jgi:L-threonylcarbamoyladenylate synthase
LRTTAAASCNLGHVRRFRIDDPSALSAAVEALASGDAVIVPTETVYGVAALPAHEDRLRELKGRPTSVPIAVLVADAAQAAEATGLPLPPRAVALADAFWPGPLTIVLSTVSGSTLGVRCPDLAFIRAVAARIGPVSTTSANRHGEPTPPDADGAASSLSGPVAVVVDGGTLDGVPSTVVDLTLDEPVVLREGPIGSEAILANLR